MTDESARGDLDPRQIAALSDLIRRARLDTPDLPELDVGRLVAYLRGEATGEEARSIQEALAASRRLREELLYLSGLADPGVQARFDETRAPLRPAAPGGAEPFQVVPGRSRPVGATPRSGRFPARYGVALVVAAAALLLLVIRPALRSDDWRPEGSLTIDQVLDQPRRGESGDGAGFHSARDAAVYALTGALDYRDGRILVRERADSAEAGALVRFRSGRQSTELIVPPDAVAVEAWRLSLPALALEGAELGDRTDVTLPGRSGESLAVVVLTYRAGPGLAVSGPRTLPPLRPRPSP